MFGKDGPGRTALKGWMGASTVRKTSRDFDESSCTSVSKVTEDGLPNRFDERSITTASAALRPRHRD